MHVHVMCPGCSKVLNAPHQMTGRSMRCPSCDDLIPIPERPWYYRQDGVDYGPVSPEVLRWLAGRGEIWPSTLVRLANGKWVAAGGISGLFEQPPDSAHTSGSNTP